MTLDKQIAEYLQKHTTWTGLEDYEQKVAYLKQLINQARIEPEEPKNEHEYKLWWIEKHSKADEIISSKDGNPIAVIYRYPPHAHIQEVDEIFREIAKAERIKELKEE